MLWFPLFTTTFVIKRHNSAEKNKPAGNIHTISPAQIILNIFFHVIIFTNGSVTMFEKNDLWTYLKREAKKFAFADMGKVGQIHIFVADFRLVKKSWHCLVKPFNYVWNVAEKLYWQGKKNNFKPPFNSGESTTRYLTLPFLFCCSFRRLWRNLSGLLEWFMFSFRPVWDGEGIKIH